MSAGPAHALAGAACSGCVTVARRADLLPVGVDSAFCPACVARAEAMPVNERLLMAAELRRFKRRLQAQIDALRGDCHEGPTR